MIFHNCSLVCCSLSEMYIVVLLLSFGAQNVASIYGGCMSYSTTVESSGHLKVKIFFLNGWKIDKGPCPSCTAADKGSDVTSERKQLIQQKNIPELFGEWTAEVYDHNGTASYIDKTRTVNNVSTDVILIVGEKEGWELIGSEISLDFDFTAKQFDMKFKSFIDNLMTLLPALPYINLQVKMDPGIRNDTNRPNTSPIVLVKPLYSLELGKVHTIHLTSVDNDGDAIRCDRALYEESSGMGPFVMNLTNQNIFSLDRVKCVMKISANQRYFNESDTFGVAITVKDYSKHNITIQGTALFPYISVMGRVVVMMYFKITGKTDPPEIIPPTPRNNQEYTIYVGGDFHVDVYAKTSAGKHITRFDFLRRDGKPVNHTSIQPAANISSNAVFISMTWSPTELEKGHHILCVNAEDNQGRMIVDLHCFRIVVKENIFRPITAENLHGKPYFISFPEPTDLSCKKGTYCRFPVYAYSTNAGGITGIVSTPKSEENVTIQYSREFINGKINAKVAQVEFLASQAGAKKICLKALDSMGYVERCLYVTVELPDPCGSDPCQHSGRCYSFDKNTKYTCSCTEEFTGLQCEKKRDFCDPNPCLFNGQCTPVQFPPFFFCICMNNSTGDICQIGKHLCDPNPCLFNGTCQEIQLHPYFFCLCLDDRRGDICQIDTSSCEMNSCNNGGFCDEHLGKKTCLCPIGFSGESCSTEFGLPQQMDNNSLKYPLFGNMLLPKQLICHLHEECELYLLVSERNGFFINIIMNSSNILEINKTRISKDYLVTLTLVPLKLSIHNLCANISQQRSSIATDMVCCSISTQNSDTVTYGGCNDDTDDCRDPPALNNICSDPTTAIYCRKSCKLCRSIPINREKELFSRPSPQNSSIYTCSPGVECHMLLYMYSGVNESCPSVSVLPTADVTVQIFNNYDGDRCLVDILIKPFSSHPGQVVNLCVKASSHDSKLSEIRCYAVEYVEHRSLQESLNFPETTTAMRQRTINTDLGNVFG